VFPADHFIAEEATFMGHVGEVAQGVARSGDDIVPLGASPTSPDTEYGWIRPARTRRAAGRSRVRAVCRFLEKPSAMRQGLSGGRMAVEHAGSRRAGERSHRVGRRCLPELSDRLEHIRPFVRLLTRVGDRQPMPWRRRRSFSGRAGANPTTFAVFACRL
jgi:hypothetical protein